MANKSKISRKGYGLLSMVLSLCLIISMFVMPTTVSAAEAATPNLIVTQDSFDTLSGWEYTDSIATTTDGKLQLTTGVNSESGTDGFIANVITRPEIATEQSVSVEVSCEDIAAGKYPAIWLRVQDDGKTQKGYVLLATLSGGRLTFGAWWLDTSSATSRTYLTAHRTIAASYFSGTAVGDTLKITFSAVGTNPTVLTMSSEFVNAGWAIETTYEDSTAEYQTSGKVGLSANSSDAANTMSFDNFVYKSDTVNVVISDDFAPQAATSLKPEWVLYQNAEDFQIVDEQLEFTVDTGVPSHGYKYRAERPASENAVNQTVSISFTRDQLDAGKMPVLWLRSEPRENGAPTGYYMFWNGSSSISIEAILPDGTSQTIVSAYRSCTSWADKFVYTFSVIDDGATTKVTGTVNYIDTTGDNNYSSWASSITGTATIPELQRSGAVAVSGIEFGGTNDTDTLTVDDFVYTTDDFTVTDDFGAGLGTGWTGYPNNSYFSRANGQMSIVAPRDLLNNRKLQRPMSESAIDQTATITTVASHYSAMARTVLWLRVQNTDSDSAPVGYYCYFVGNVMYVGKATADGTNTDLATRSCNISDYSIFDSITYNFSAKGNADGTTVLYFQLVGNKNNGTTNLVMDLSATDDTAELQKAGTVAITSQQTKWNTTEQTIFFDNFRYTYPKITAETESTVDIRSLVRLKRYLVGDRLTIGAYADYNEDGLINALDLTKLRKYLLGTELIGGNLVESEEITGAASAAPADYKAKIATLDDTVNATGTTYYVSADGDDNNIGTSPEKALKTPEAINDLTLTEGDAVLFERGDSFRITEAVAIESGVSYGAYGEGDKPLLIGSLKDYADPLLWTSENGKLWKASVNGPEAGNIVFNGGKSFGYFKFNLEDVKQNGDYCYVRNEDNATGTVYMYLNTGNPGKYFDSIEISSTEQAFYKASARNNVKIENIAMKYFAQFGVSTVNSTDFNISGCEIGYIGGGQQDIDGTRGARLGNGIEFFGSSQDCTIENNYLYQIFDAAISFQGPGNYLYKGFHNFDINNNLIEYCSMNFEFWISDAQSTTDAKISNIDFKNNILRFGGYGFGALTRENSTPHAFVLGWDFAYNDDQIENFNITGNTFDCTAHHFFRTTNHIDLINVTGNSYYQCDGCENTVIYNSGLYATDAESLYAAVTTIDKSPANVGWINADGSVDLYEVVDENYEDSASDPWA